ncbi:MAG: site-specific integrase [Clostridia bacterium]|nr:site-specific integrase [Clostridia bacterium]
MQSAIYRLCLGGRYRQACKPEHGYLPFKSFLAQHGLPKIRFHELRHSCASLLIACGVSMKEIQEWLGHSAISTTADIYSHLNYSSKLNVANTLTSVFGGETMLSGQQDSAEAQALLTALFRGAEHE